MIWVTRGISPGSDHAIGDQSLIILMAAARSPLAIFKTATHIGSFSSISSSGSSSFAGGAGATGLDVGATGLDVGAAGLDVGASGRDVGASGRDVGAAGRDVGAGTEKVCPPPGVQVAAEAEGFHSFAPGSIVLILFAFFLFSLYPLLIEVTLFV